MPVYELGMKTRYRKGSMSETCLAWPRMQFRQLARILTLVGYPARSLLAVALKDQSRYSCPGSCERLRGSVEASFELGLVQTDP
jgi:hypothetical protein